LQKLQQPILKLVDSLAPPHSPPALGGWTIYPATSQYVVFAARKCRSGSDLAPTLVTLPSMSLIPFVPFGDVTANEQSAAAPVTEASVWRWRRRRWTGGLWLCFG